MRKAFLLVAIDDIPRVGMGKVEKPEEIRFLEMVTKRCDKPTEGLSLVYTFPRTIIVEGPQTMIHFKSEVLEGKGYNTSICDEGWFKNFQRNLFVSETANRIGLPS